MQPEQTDLTTKNKNHDNQFIQKKKSSDFEQFEKDEQGRSSIRDAFQ